MANSAVNKDKFIERINASVQTRLQSALAQVRSYVEPLRQRIEKLEQRLAVAEKENEALRQQLMDMAAAVDDGYGSCC